MYLSQAHLVSQDTVDALLIQRGQPVEAFDLVLFERGHEHLRLSNSELAQRSGVLEVELVRVDCIIVSTIRGKSREKKLTIDERSTIAARGFHVLVCADVRLPLRELERLIRLPLQGGVGVELLRLLLGGSDCSLGVVAGMAMDVRLILYMNRSSG